MSIPNHTIIVHLTSNDPMRAAKALRFANKALPQFSNVILYFTVEGVKTVQISKGGFALPGTEKNSLDALREFIKNNGKVLIGKECLKLYDISPTDIPDGCEPATSESMFDYLKSANTKMISW